MYEMIKTVIASRTYTDSNALIAKIQRLYIEGTLTESQYTELRTMLAEQNPVKAYDVESELDRVWVELRRIASIVDSMPEPTPEPEPSEDVPNWVQPTGAHDAYQKGDKVRYNGNVYESLVDGNVWSPDAYPAGWQKLAQ
jgi:hypothetical protein